MEHNASLFFRSSGVLLHPTALPGSQPCGSFGAASRSWLHLLAANGISFWQVLPLSPPDSTGSPYSSPSSFALNPGFLDVDDLVRDGFLPASSIAELYEADSKNSIRVDFSLVELKNQTLGELLKYHWPEQSNARHEEFNNWCLNQPWLNDYSLFMVLRRRNKNLPWWQWSEPFSTYQKIDFEKYYLQYHDLLIEHKLLQWHLERQWRSIKNLAKDLGIKIFGDLPFYVSRDSVDVWSNPELFSVSESGELQYQSGVPPDYFSETGQLWGTPIYLWEEHQKSNFQWWRNRFSRQLEQFNLIRLDHFRALFSYWSISGEKNTAIDGIWQKSPGEDLLKMLLFDCGERLPLVAEDLGIITPEVELLRDKFNLPGMKILQFAFNGESQNPYLPENIKGNNWVVYTGTHDNPTAKGWWSQLNDECKNQFKLKYNGKYNSAPWMLIDMGLSTEAGLMIAPLQDLLSLDDEARFNTPGSVGGNWQWRLSGFDEKVLNAAKLYGERSEFWGRNFNSHS